jgi:uncharacterized protein YggE
MRNKTLFIIGVLLLGVALTACGSVAAAQDATPSAQSGSEGNPPRTLSVSGNGKAFLSPDIAYINIGVHTAGPDAAQAVADNNTQSQQVIDAIVALGIEAKDIQTLNFSIYPQQQYDPQGMPSGEITYMVDNTVYVTVRDLSKLGDLLDTAVSAGANSINGIQFDVADRDAALSEARKAAVADAQAQAQELAEVAGVTLGGIQNISTVSGGIPQVPFYDGRGGGVAAEAASTPISPGQMLVTVDVTVVYQIQ